MCKAARLGTAGLGAAVISSLEEGRLECNKHGQNDSKVLMMMFLMVIMMIF